MIDGGDLFDMVNTATKYVITECCQAPVYCVSASLGSLVLLLRCAKCKALVGTPGLEDIEDAQG